MLSMVRPSGVVNSVRLLQTDNIHHCSLFTAPEWCAFCSITTTVCYYRRLVAFAKKCDVYKSTYLLTYYN